MKNKKTTSILTGIITILISIIIAAFILLATLIFNSCTTVSAKEELDPNFIADLPSYELDSIILLSGTGKNKPKSNGFTYTFDPKTNVVEVETKVSIDKYLFTLTPEVRKELAVAMNEYLALYEAKELPEQTPSKKNAFSTGKIKIYWGVMSYSYTCEANYYTNYQYVENGKPFFILTIESSPVNGSDAYSPAARFYLTPSQIRKQFEMLDQETLEADAHAMEEELYFFE